ncbi:MAG: hypothetical protein ACFB00_00505, partial [Parvularculaceae bacterium]
RDRSLRSLYRRSDGVRGRGASMEYLAHSSSFCGGVSLPPHTGTKHLGQASNTVALFDIDAAVVGGASLAIVALLAAVGGFILTSRRLGGSSLFNRLFVVVATTSGFFSAVSSAIGFALITSQETDDVFRNVILPPAFGVFVFFLAVTIWVGGAAFVRDRDWFRGMAPGAAADAAYFAERAIKLFVVIPILAIILFFVSTWTTVVGIGGVDAVRHTYNYELRRIQAECGGITAHRQKDFLFLADLGLAVGDVARVARNEAELGVQTGSAGRGAVSNYFSGVAAWLAGLEASVAEIIEAPDPTGVDPYDPQICPTRMVSLETKLAANAYENYDLWARELQTDYNDFITVLNRWRRDRRIEILLEQQLAGFARANPKPARMTQTQERVIDAYADEVEAALRSLIRKQKLAKPPIPVPSAAELSPARGLAIVGEVFRGPQAPVEDERKSRTVNVVYEQEYVPQLSTITPRDAVLKNANVFSDIWALSIAWDYASYVLMLAYLFFPSAERAAGFKDETA